MVPLSTQSHLTTYYASRHNWEGYLSGGDWYGATRRNEKLIFLHLFTDLFCKDFSSLLRIFAVGLPLAIPEYISSAKVRCYNLCLKKSFFFVRLLTPSGVIKNTN